LSGGGSTFQGAYTKLGIGGVAAGGAATFSGGSSVNHLFYTGLGGVSVAGAASYATNHHLVATGSGGVLSGGTAPHKDTATWVGHGGLTASGSAQSNPPATSGISPSAAGRKRNGVGGHHYLPDTGLVFPERVFPLVAKVQSTMPLPQVALVVGVVPSVFASVKSSMPSPTLRARAEAKIARVQIVSRLGMPSLTVEAVVHSQSRVMANIPQMQSSITVKHEVFSSEEMNMILMIIGNLAA